MDQLAGQFYNQWLYKDQFGRAGVPSMPRVFSVMRGASNVLEREGSAIARRGDSVLPFSMGLLIGGLGAALSCVILLGPSEKSFPVAQSVPSVAPIIESKLTEPAHYLKLEESTQREIESIKKIVTGLVGVVKSLNDERVQAPQTAPTQPAIPEFKLVQIRVIGPKGELREEPNASSKLVSTVPPYTLLLAQEKQTEWFKVTTPLGGLAWIHSSAVYKDLKG